MEFLYKLYSNNYFGIGLFIVITILAFTFLIILFFGKKDQKNREEKAIEEKKNKNIEVKETTEPTIEMEALEPIEQITLNETTIENVESLPEVENVSTEEKKPEEIEIYEEKPLEEMDPFVTSNIVLNTDYIQEESRAEEDNKTLDTAYTSDIYNLNSIIKEEPITVVEEPEQSIDDVLNKYDAIEETMLKEQPIPIDMDEQRTERNQKIEENDVNIFRKSEESVKKTATPFSSVYLTKEEAPKQQEQVVQSSTLSRSNFEMPKRMDLPKRSTNAINENIISSMNRESITDNPFDNLDEDSYNIREK